MGVFKRKQTKCTQENGGNEVRKIRCDEVYVLTTEIISNHDDGSGWDLNVLRYITWGPKKMAFIMNFFQGKD